MPNRLSGFSEARIYLDSVQHVEERCPMEHCRFTLEGLLLYVVVVRCCSRREPVVENISILPASFLVDSSDRILPT